jgi:hypothetical protein
MSFTRIPDDILVLILENFDRKQDQKVIAALRVTNKRFQNITLPLIYHTAVDRINRTPKVPEDKVGQLQLWAWRISQQPDNAQFLKEIDLKNWDHIGKDHGIPIPRVEACSIADPYRVALSQTNLPKILRVDMVRELRKETSVAHLAFILAMCPGLEVLRIPQSFGVFGHLVIEVIQHSTGASYPHQYTTLPSLPAGSPLLKILMMGSIREMTFGKFRLPD